MMDPATTWVDADVVLSPDVTLLPGVQLLGATVVDGGRRRSARTRTLKDCEIGAGARVVRTHGELAVIGAGATVGPFAYLRPGTDARRRRQDRHLRRDQERPDRRRRQGPAPVLRRRRRDRRGHQHRRRHDLRQLRRRREAPHRGRPARQDRRQQHLRRAGRDRRRRRHRRAAPSYAATCRRARSRSAAGRSATSRGWALSQAGRDRPGGRARPRARSTAVEALSPDSGVTPAETDRAEEPRQHDGHEAHHREEPDGLQRPGAPRARRGGRRAPRHRAGADSRPTSSPTARSTSATRSRCAAATPS